MGRINAVMKTISLDYFRERIRNSHPRTRKALLNTVLGLFIKGGGMLISLLLVPLTIDYLSKDVYGTWLTVSSIVTMLTFFDIGIGNGLRNKLSQALSQNDITLARSYISTTYFVFGAIQMVFIIIFLLIFQFIPWQQILNTSVDNSQLQFVILLTAVAMAIKLVLDILVYVLLALQESGLAGGLALLANLLMLIGTYLLSHFAQSNLTLLAALTALSPIAITLISSILLYNTRLSIYQPTFRLANFRHAKGLLSLGYKFFIIQVSGIILFYTDNIIITQLFGPSEVTTYNVAFRYFNSINMVFAIAITPYWSAFTEAFVKNDVVWMKRTYTHLQKFWLALVPVVLLMVLVADPFYFMWVGNRVVVPHSLNVCMSFFVIVCCWNSTTTAVVNGLGKIRLQLFYALIAAMVNIPLAILFGRVLHMGSAGVVLATSISLLIGSVFGALQARKLISGNAKGIWNQ